MLAFVAQHGGGPLFYRRAQHDDNTDPLKAKKPRYVQARQRLAAWVRRLGISDEELSPNHAWRHSVKQIADRAGSPKRMSDYITGHAQGQPRAARRRSRGSYSTTTIMGRPRFTAFRGRLET